MRSPTVTGEMARVSRLAPPGYHVVFPPGGDLAAFTVTGLPGAPGVEPCAGDGGGAGCVNAGHAKASPGVSEVPELRLVIGADGDPRAGVRVANALLDQIVSGAVRAGSRVPPVTSLGLEPPNPPGAAARAFRELTGEGVLRWVPERGYYIRTQITVTVSDRTRGGSGLTAVLTGIRQRPGAGRGMPTGSDARAR